MIEKESGLEKGLRGILTGNVKPIQEEPAVRVPKVPKGRLSVLD